MARLWVWHGFAELCGFRRADLMRCADRITFRAMSQRAWNNWYHAMGNTFGTWPPGDDRGWRSWRHREHCEGDYKNPPPREQHGQRLRRSLALMKRPAVHLRLQHRVIAARALGEKLRELDAEVIDLCVTKAHYHILARFAAMDLGPQALAQLYERLRLVAGNMLDDGRDPLPRHVVGLAKKHASFKLREASGIFDGGIWARKCKIMPIEDRRHQLNASHYIRGHVDEGGAVLSVIAPELVARLKK
jgi:hypothetical protein